MTCYYPVPVWKAKQANPSGKHSVVFSENLGIDGTRFELPCGGCIGCRLDRSAEWQSRLIHESKEHQLNCFLTLTYNEENVPDSGTLVKKHAQDFLKRLRKTIQPQKIRFFACGEYGEKTNRPHYHMLIFGYDFPDKKRVGKSAQGHHRYISQTLDNIWGKGKCEIGSVTPESCGYVARYVMKKVRGDRALEHYQTVNRITGEITPILPEYAHMSTRPAIGLTFYEKFKGEIHIQDSVLINGKKRKTPRYYDKQLDKTDPLRLEELKFIRAEKAATRASDSTPARLAVREEFKKERIKNLTRKFL